MATLYLPFVNMTSTPAVSETLDPLDPSTIYNTCDNGGTHDFGATHAGISAYPSGSPSGSPSSEADSLAVETADSFSAFVKRHPFLFWILLAILILSFFSMRKER